MTFFDAHSHIGSLRDHLARHDKPIAFLFGAGTSCAIKIAPDGENGEIRPLIPDVAGITSACECSVRKSGADSIAAWDQIVGECASANEAPTIEAILNRLRLMIDAVGASETLAGLDRSGLVKIERIIRKRIAELVNPDTSGILPRIPHVNLARWITRTTRSVPIEIFTVNYDVLFELALESARAPFFDGFVGSYEPFFHPESIKRFELAPELNWSRLWKLHGSVNWHKKVVGDRTEIVRSNANASGEMILPTSQKYVESRQQPYVAFMNRLSSFLEKEDALLVAVGFGFADEHINDLVFAALDGRPRNHLYALQFEEMSEDADLISRSLQQNNIIVMGPRTGIVGGQKGCWGVPRNSQLNSSAVTVDNENEDSMGSLSMVPASVGIGEFGVFCEFLTTMVAR